MLGERGARSTECKVDSSQAEAELEVGSGSAYAIEEAENAKSRSVGHTQAPATQGPLIELLKWVVVARALSTATSLCQMGTLEK